MLLAVVRFEKGPTVKEEGVSRKQSIVRNCHGNFPNAILLEKLVFRFTALSVIKIRRGATERKRFIIASSRFS